MMTSGQKRTQLPLRTTKVHRITLPPRKIHFLERILPKYLHISIKSSNFAAESCKGNKNNN